MYVVYIVCRKGAEKSADHIVLNNKREHASAFDKPSTCAELIGNFVHSAYCIEYTIPYHARFSNDTKLNQPDDGIEILLSGAQ